MPARFISRRIRVRARPRKCNRPNIKGVITDRKNLRKSPPRRRAIRLADPSFSDSAYPSLFVVWVSSAHSVSVSSSLSSPCCCLRFLPNSPGPSSRSYRARKKPSLQPEYSLHTPGTSRRPCSKAKNRPLLPGGFSLCGLSDREGRLPFFPAVDESDKNDHPGDEMEPI